MPLSLSHVPLSHAVVLVFWGKALGRQNLVHVFGTFMISKLKCLPFFFIKKKKERKCSLRISVAWWPGLLYNWSKEGRNILRIRDLVEERKAKFRYGNDPVALGVSRTSSEPGGAWGGGRQAWKEGKLKGGRPQLSLKCLRQYSVGEFFFIPTV